MTMLVCTRSCSEMSTGIIQGIHSGARGRKLHFEYQLCSSERPIVSELGFGSSDDMEMLIGVANNMSRSRNNLEGMRKCSS